MLHELLNNSALQQNEDALAQREGQNLQGGRCGEVYTEKGYTA